MLPADRANVKPFLTPDQIRAKLPTRPDRRPVYSYLLRLLCSPTSGRAYTKSYGHGLFQPCLGDAVLNLYLFARPKRSATNFPFASKSFNSGDPSFIPKRARSFPFLSTRTRKASLPTVAALTPAIVP